LASQHSGTGHEPLPKARIGFKEPDTGCWMLAKTASAAAAPGKHLNPLADQPWQAE
jgi:hypothetical protein